MCRRSQSPKAKTGEVGEIGVCVCVCVCGGGGAGGGERGERKWESLQYIDFFFAWGKIIFPHLSYRSSHQLGGPPMAEGFHTGGCFLPGVSGVGVGGVVFCFCVL